MKCYLCLHLKKTDKRYLKDREFVFKLYFIIKGELRDHEDKLEDRSIRSKPKSELDLLKNTNLPKRYNSMETLTVYDSPAPPQRKTTKFIKFESSKAIPFEVHDASSAQIKKEHLAHKEQQYKKGLQNENDRLIITNLQRARSVSNIPEEIYSPQRERSRSNDYLEQMRDKYTGKEFISPKKSYVLNFNQGIKPKEPAIHKIDDWNIEQDLIHDERKDSGIGNVKEYKDRQEVKRNTHDKAYKNTLENELKSSKQGHKEGKGIRQRLNAIRHFQLGSHKDQIDHVLPISNEEFILPGTVIFDSVHLPGFYPEHFKCTLCDCQMSYHRSLDISKSVVLYFFIFIFLLLSVGFKINYYQFGKMVWRDIFRVLNYYE
jgi:hypothetical protein